MIKVSVTLREAAALKHWRQCDECRGTRDGAIDDAITCLRIEFAPIDARMNELQEEFAELESLKMYLVRRPIPKKLKGRYLE